MNSKPPTPDAIRAAIAEVLADHPNIKLSVQVHRHVVAADVHDRLAQIGALPEAGSVTISKEDAQAASSACTAQAVSAKHPDDAKMWTEIAEWINAATITPSTEQET